MREPLGIVAAHAHHDRIELGPFWLVIPKSAGLLCTTTSHGSRIEIHDEMALSQDVA